MPRVCVQASPIPVLQHTNRSLKTMYIFCYNINLTQTTHKVLFTYCLDLYIYSHGRFLLFSNLIDRTNSTKPKASTQFKAWMCMVLCYTVCSQWFSLKNDRHRLDETAGHFYTRLNHLSITATLKRPYYATFMQCFNKASFLESSGVKKKCYDHLLPCGHAHFSTSANANNGNTSNLTTKPSFFSSR